LLFSKSLRLIKLLSGNPITIGALLRFLINQADLPFVRLYYSTST
jgi:hypothetical protein